ncbi:S41 family peptidase [Xanthomonas campestris pv. raphani]|uniref:S41 family peptidase n=1 Tax=Xanthomonas campestris TaxID=339 RepID=UPI0023E99752|nr:S41 family peptidase [Xanthomonas campestris]MCW2038660.1 C-terminal processing protease CtpA/Prc [Xanthomonas campestris]MEA9829191.1 S41 family peptidase [Xanthomonas campestris pv. raphani]
MDFVANTDALIIDLRENAGSDPAMVVQLASYRFDTRAHLHEIVTRKGGVTEQAWTTPGLPGQAFGGSKPVYLLNSQQTFSASEDVAYALQALARATVVGEITVGGAHPSRGFKISNQVVAVVPYARSVSPITRGNLERSGVIPDVAVPAAQTQQTAYRSGVQALIAGAANEGEAAGLRALLEDPASSCVMVARASLHARQQRPCRSALARERRSGECPRAQARSYVGMR